MPRTRKYLGEEYEIGTFGGAKKKQAVASSLGNKFPRSQSNPPGEAEEYTHKKPAIPAPVYPENTPDTPAMRTENDRAVVPYEPGEGGDMEVEPEPTDAPMAAAGRIVTGKHQIRS